MGENVPCVDDVVAGRWEVHGDDVRLNDLDVRHRADRVEVRGVDVHGIHATIGADALGKPCSDRARSGTDLQAPPARSDTGSLQVTDR